MRPREDVQRQVAVAAIVAVEEAPFLFAVQRRIGDVEIENHLLGRFLVRLDESREQQLVNVLERATDLVVAVDAVGGTLQTVQGRLAGQQRQYGVVAQLIVIVDIFVPQRDRIDALLDQLGDAVLDAFGIAMIVEAGGQSVEQPEPPIDLAEQRGSPVGADLASVEARCYLPPEMLAKAVLLLLTATVTMCGHGLFPPAGRNVLLLRRLCHRNRPVFSFIVIFPG